MKGWQKGENERGESKGRRCVNVSQREKKRERLNEGEFEREKRIEKKEELRVYKGGKKLSSLEQEVENPLAPAN